VVKSSVWPAGSLRDAKPPVSADRTLYSVTVEVHTSAPRNHDAALARPGMVVEAFSTDPLPGDLVGKQITADVTLAGDTRGVRWWISNVRRMTSNSQ